MMMVLDGDDDDDADGSDDDDDASLRMQELLGAAHLGGPLALAAAQHVPVGDAASRLGRQLCISSGPTTIILVTEDSSSFPTTTSAVTGTGLCERASCSVACR